MGRCRDRPLQIGSLLRDSDLRWQGSAVTAPLRARLTRACDGSGLSQSDLTVLSARRDPYRLDTPAMHCAGQWLAGEMQRLHVRTPVHLRGMFYVLVAAGDIRRPNGDAFINIDDNWVWLQETAAKAGRWLGYVPWHAIKDERNEPPEIYVPVALPPAPCAHVAFDLHLDLPSADWCRPSVYVDGFNGRQPYRLVLLGEKTSLGDVLRPIARSYGAMLVLATGEFSDTLIYEIAKSSAEDGRPTVILYFADCDPAGHQMSIVARKLQALRDLAFPTLDIHVHPVALTPAQVRGYGLPCTPLKDTEQRADRWKRAFGVEQTEIDALAALRPDLLRRLAEEAIAPFYDKTLDRRLRQARSDYQARARAAFEAQADRAAIARVQAKAAQFLAGVQEGLQVLRQEMATAVPYNSLSLPRPDVPSPNVTGLPCTQALYQSDWDWTEATQRLRLQKLYGDEAVS